MGPREETVSEVLYQASGPISQSRSLSSDHIELPTLIEVQLAWVRLTNITLLSFPPFHGGMRSYPLWPPLLTGVLAWIGSWDHGRLRGTGQNCIMKHGRIWMHDTVEKDKFCIPKIQLKFSFIIAQSLAPERSLLLTQCGYLPQSHLSSFACLIWCWLTALGELEKTELSTRRYLNNRWGSR